MLPAPTGRRGPLVGTPDIPGPSGRTVYERVTFVFRVGGLIPAIPDLGQKFDYAGSAKPVPGVDQHLTGLDYDKDRLDAAYQHDTWKYTTERFIPAAANAEIARLSRENAELFFTQSPTARAAMAESFRLLDSARSHLVAAQAAADRMKEAEDKATREKEYDTMVNEANQAEDDIEEARKKTEEGKAEDEKAAEVPPTTEGGEGQPNPMEDSYSRCSQLEDFLEYCEETSWASFDCQNYISFQNGCDLRVFDPGPDDPQICGDNDRTVEILEAIIRDCYKKVITG